MKSVLISIQPKWCGLIASGKKTIEVRKSRPKLKTPFKCYIYCTKNPKLQFWKAPRYSYADDHSHNQFDRCGNGKVIGEFVCDSIRCFDVPYPAYQGHMDKSILEQSYLTYDQLHRYAYHDALYGWHISNLKIYDQPKELSEFSVVDKEAVKRCEFRERIYNNPAYTNGALLLGSYICTDADSEDWCIECITKPIKRPPQSWCYVEEF